MLSTAPDALSLGGDDPNRWQAVLRPLLVAVLSDSSHPTLAGLDRNVRPGRW